MKTRRRVALFNFMNSNMSNTSRIRARTRRPARIHYLNSRLAYCRRREPRTWLQTSIMKAKKFTFSCTFILKIKKTLKGRDNRLHPMCGYSFFLFFFIFFYLFFFIYLFILFIYLFIYFFLCGYSCLKFLWAFSDLF